MLLVTEKYHMIPILFDIWSFCRSQYNVIFQDFNSKHNVQEITGAIIFPCSPAALTGSSRDSSTVMLSDILISQILPFTPTPTLTLTRIRHPLRTRDLRIPRTFCPGFIRRISGAHTNLKSLPRSVPKTVT